MATSTVDIETKSDIESEHARLQDINLTCLICKQSLHHPRVLDCLHSFCEECVSNNLTKVEYDEEEEEQDFIKCFKCLEVTEIPSDDVAMLPYNFFANNAIDYLLIQCTKENAILCTNCLDEADAISRCVDCSEFLCLKCVTAHRRLKPMKEHKVLALDILRYDRSSVHRPVHCPEHEPEVFTYYCEVCQDLICRECTILEHRGHKYERLCDALEIRKPEILALLEENEKLRVPPIERAVDDVQDMAARLHARTIATKQAVKNCTAQCIRSIEARCIELLAEVDEVYKKKSVILQNQQRDLQLFLMKNKTATQFVTYGFKHGNEAEIFELFDVMKERLKVLNSTKLDYKEPNENDVIDHVFDTNLVENIADNLGEISTSRIFLAHTRVYGPGLLTAKVGIDAYFVIEVFDRDGIVCIENTQDDSFRVKVQAPEGFNINTKIQNRQDGSYVVRYTPVTTGKHEVLIKIRGRNFPKNKHTVRVYEGIDYTKVDSAFLVFGHTNSNGHINSKLSLKHPWGITIDKDSRIYVTDYGNHRVVVYDQFGSSIREFGSKGSKDGHFNGPTGIAIDQSGVVYVADWDNHRVQYFSPDSNYFIGKFGSKGHEKGQLCHPAGIAIDKNGSIVVTERDNHRVQVFTSDGNPLVVIGSYGSEIGEFDSPTHIAVKDNSTYVVADSGNDRVVIFDSQGLFLNSFGTKGSSHGEFKRPSGIACDREGYIIVGDFQNHRVQVFTPALRFFTSFGKEGSSDVQFKHPSGIFLTNEGRVAVVDRFNSRVQVF